MALRAVLTLACLGFVPAVVGAPLRRLGVPAPVRWCCGTVAIAWIVAVLHAARAPHALAVGASLVVLLVAGLRERFVGAHPSVDTPGIRFPVVLLLAGLGLPLFLETLGTPVNAWDAVAIWYAKTRHLEAWPPAAAMPVPDYPNLGPTAWMLAASLAGGAADPLPRLVFPALYLSWIAGLSVLLGRRRPWLAAAVVGVAALQVLDVEAVTSGYQEATVAAVAGTAALLFLRSLTDGPTDAHEGSAVLGAALAASAGMIKVEGALVGTILFAAWVVARWGRASEPSTLRAACVFVPIVLAWPILVALNGVDPGRMHMALRPSSLLEIPYRLDRLHLIGSALMEQTVQRGHAWLGSVVLSVATLWLFPSLRRALVFLWVAVVLHLAMIVAIYLSVDVALEWYVETSCARLVSLANFLPVTLLVLCTMHLMEIVAPFRPVAAKSAAGRWRMRFAS